MEIMRLHKKWLLGLALAGALPVFAQDPGPSGPPPSGGWRRFESNTPPQDNGDATAPDTNQDQAPPPQAPPPRRRQYQAPPPVSNAPFHVTLPVGTWVTIRVNEPISSDHNKPGDAFTGTLLQPVIANGLVIAPRGQMVSGVVSEAQKAGRVKGL